MAHEIVIKVLLHVYIKQTKRQYTQQYDYFFITFHHRFIHLKEVQEVFVVLKIDVLY